MTPAKVKQVCARTGCKKHLSLEARLHGDLYCSSVCCRLDLGTISIEDARAAKERADRVLASGGDQAWRERGRDYVRVVELLLDAGAELEPRFADVAEGPLAEWLGPRGRPET